MKHHMAPPAPPVVVSGPRQCLTVPELASADGNFTALLAAAKVSDICACCCKMLALPAYLPTQGLDEESCLLPALARQLWIASCL